MKKTKKFLNLRLELRLFLTYIIIISLIELCILCIISFKIYNQNKQNYANFINQYNQKIDNDIDNSINDLNKISYIYISDYNIGNILKKNNKQTPKEYIEDYRVIRNAIDHSLRFNSMVWGVTFVGLNGSIYSNTSIDKNYIEGKLKKWLLYANASESNRWITPVHKEDYSQNGMDLISIINVLKELGTNKIIGYSYIDINFNFIKDIAGDTNNMYENVNTFFVQNDNVIYDSSKENIINYKNENNILSNIRENLDNKNIGKFSLKINNKKYMLVARKNKTTGLIIVQYVPLDAIDSIIVKNIASYVVYLIILLIISILLSYYLTIKNVKPFNDFIKAMKKAEKGEFVTIDENIQLNDELKEIIITYNKMIIMLVESIKKEYVIKMNQKKMQIKMLQSQVNPHFLYNTLNLISSLAELRGVDEISKISNSLSKLFRYSVKGKDIVLLKEELEHVKSYTNILEMRYPNKLKIIYNINQGLEEFTTLKFILQPIVENAIYHGLEYKGFKGTITISAKKMKQKLILEVEDDGKGMTQDELDNIKEEINKDILFNNEETKIGLKNVHQRVKDYYGIEYGIEIISQINKGTKVIITIPIIKNIKEEV